MFIENSYVIFEKELRNSRLYSTCLGSFSQLLTDSYFICLQSFFGSCSLTIDLFFIYNRKVEREFMSTLLFAIEGSDGTGKETQSIILQDWFLLNEKTVSRVSFPRYKKTAAGWALWEALKGDNAAAYDFVHVDPLAASLLYAADRRESLPFLKKEMDTHDVIIFDRYVESNLLHQGGKLKNNEEREAFADAIYLLEYRINKLPHPNVTIYLDLPVSVAIARAKKRAQEKGEEPDTVESNYEYIKNSHETGLFYAQKFNWLIISCVRRYDSHEYTREEISTMIIGKLRNRLDLSF
jgi:dTMP kinase